MFAGLTGWHLLIILAVILLLFGATKLPALSKSVGQSMRIFKNEVKTMKEEDSKGAPVSKDADASDVDSLSADSQKASATDSSSQTKS
ncbi:Sec-independent protein translocase subunit TatA [Rathayibacter soli]|uniref:Sec-independent protein translocase subunit TatA n=1 Tax=Rathayibacter soli TaxID=3144168 RepID=UPI0027E467F8|nr:Sec-independent protein translocase subunit TatA [Glaciibacter superstes]